MNEKYAAYPSALVYEDVDGRPGRKVVENLLWGDAIDLRSGTHGDYVKVRVRTGESSKRIYGWMKRDSIQDEALAAASGGGDHHPPGQGPLLRVQEDLRHAPPDI